jgi:hypothetical protein
LSGCTTTNYDDNSWGTFVPVPFSGYICGFEESQTLMQLPYFYSSSDKLSVEDVSQINLLGDNLVLRCEKINMLQPKSNDEYDYMLSTLSFRVNMPEHGEYIVSKIEIVLQDKRVITRELGEINFTTISSNVQTMPISMTQFMINQADYTELKVAFKNESVNTVDITSLSYLDEMYENCTIKKYLDFELNEEEEGLNIPARETRTFLFSLSPNDSYFNKGEEHYLYLLPLIYFSENNVDCIMPAQTQATIVQPPFKPEYALELMSGNIVQ